MSSTSQNTQEIAVATLRQGDSRKSIHVHAAFALDTADLDIRQDFDALWASWNSPHIRWFGYDSNRNADPALPNGIHDGFKLYLIEYMLKHPEALPEGIDHEVFTRAWVENQGRMADYLGANGVSHSGSVNTLAAYILLGDSGSNARAQILSAYPSLYGNPGVPIHTFTHLPQYLALDADPDGDGYTNLQEWQYIKLYEANPGGVVATDGGRCAPGLCLDSAVRTSARRGVQESPLSVTPSNLGGSVFS